MKTRFYFAAALLLAAQASAQAQGDRTELTFWQSVQNSGDVADYQAYLNRYPQGPHADQARSKISSFNGGANTGSIAEHWRAANTAYNAENYAAAISELLAIRAMDPNYDIHVALMNAYRRTNNFAAALDEGRQAEVKSPSDANLARSIGIIYHNLKDYGGAIAEYQRVLDLVASPLAQDYANIGFSYLNRANTSSDPDQGMDDSLQAQKFMEQAAALDSDKFYKNVVGIMAEIHNRRGARIFRQGDYEAAVTEFMEAIKLDDGRAVFYGNVGRSLLELGAQKGKASAYGDAIALYGKAKDYYSEALSRDGGNDGYRVNVTRCDARIHNTRGIAYSAAGDSETAIAEFEQATQQWPEDAVIAGNLQREQARLEARNRAREPSAGQVALGMLGALSAGLNFGRSMSQLGSGGAAALAGAAGMVDSVNTLNRLTGVNNSTSQFLNQLSPVMNNTASAAARVSAGAAGGAGGQCVPAMRQTMAAAFMQAGEASQNASNMASLGQMDNQTINVSYQACRQASPGNLQSRDINQRSSQEIVRTASLCAAKAAQMVIAMHPSDAQCQAAQDDALRRVGFF